MGLAKNAHRRILRASTNVRPAKSRHPILGRFVRNAPSAGAKNKRVRQHNSSCKIHLFTDQRNQLLLAAQARPKVGQDCINFNSQVERYAINNKSIELVVLASRWEHILSMPKQLTSDGNLVELKSLNIDDIANRLTAMINRIRAAGKKVVVVAPPPALEFNIANCHDACSEVNC